MQGSALAATPLGEPCLDRSAVALLDQQLEVDVALSPRIALPAGQGADLLVQVAEQGIDVEAVLVARDGTILGRADYPLTRQGVQRLVVPAAVSGVQVQVHSVEYKTHRGSVRLLVSALQPQRLTTGCERFMREFARADSLFAGAQLSFRSDQKAATAAAESQAKRAGQSYASLATAPVVQPSPEIRGEAELAVAAIEYYSLSRWDESANWATRAALSFEQSNRPYLRARARAISASAWLEKPGSQGGLERARAVHRELAAFHLARGEAYDYALQINNAGLSYLNEARFEQAIELFSEAKRAFESIGEKQRGALAAQNIALCEWGLGRMQRVAPMFSQALEAMGPDWRPKLYLLTLNNSALASNAAGHFDESLRMHENALQLAAQQSNALYVARSLFGIGVTYYAIGGREMARNCLLDALATMTAELDSRGRVSVLRALANIESEAGNYALADAYNREAMSLAVSATIKDRIQLKIAETAISRGALKIAEEQLEKLSRGVLDQQRLTRAQVWMVRAKLRRAQGSLETALQDLQSALPIFSEYESVNDEFACRLELARVLKAANREPDALREVGAALELSEAIRRQTANPEYSASMAAQLRPALELKIELLRSSYEQRLRSGQRDAARKIARESLEFTDASRARAFQLYLRQKIDAGNDPLTAELLEKAAELQRDLADRRYYLATQEDGRGPMSPVVQSLRADIRQLRLKLDVVNTQLATRAGKRRVQRSGASSDVLQRFGGDASTAGLEYWIGTANAYAWVVRGGEISWLDLGSGPRIADAAQRFHASLSDFTKVPMRDRVGRAEELHALVVQPLLKSIAGASHLVIVPDGPLHFVPFAALRSSEGARRYLVENVSIASTPALRYSPLGGRLTTSNGAGRLLLVDDPIYEATDSRRVDLAVRPEDRLAAAPRSQSRGLADPSRLGRLASTAREAAVIRSLFGASKVDELAGPDAIRDSFLERDLGRYQYLHVATHGLMDGEIPAMSALILGAFGRTGRVKDQQVRVGDLLTRTLDAELVVLSACDTSLGPSFPEEGPMGLRYAVLARGARAVVSSLWATVDDRNADLMTEMYGRMMREHERIDVALAGAMRTLLGRASTTDPAFWAPYTVYIAEK